MTLGPDLRPVSINGTAPADSTGLPVWLAFESRRGHASLFEQLQAGRAAAVNSASLPRHRAGAVRATAMQRAVLSSAHIQIHNRICSRPAGLGVGGRK